MQYHTHVYLGPTLDLATAKQYLWDAHYHPPIQCGDLIRLLRLKPKRVVIIDGIYESVPAVWHKEIMILLAHQIPVYGAASMGALRAAELYQYGMKGLGAIFEDFKSGVLGDDDEVAVLHQGKEEHYLAVNDAMVNIRATCEFAYLKKMLTQEEKNQLIAYCKNQFYPYRSLKHAIKQLPLNNKQDLSLWLEQHNLIDLKKNDAILALKHVQKLISENLIEENNKIDIQATKFIASLIDETEGTPFAFQETWLPDIEKKLHQLSIQNATEFNLINKLSTLIKYISTHADHNALPDMENSLTYIKQHQLYLPLLKIKTMEPTSALFQFYTLILHQICIHQITEQRIKAYSPTLMLYFNMQEEDSHRVEHLIELMILLVLLGYLQLNDSRLKIKQNVISHHLQENGFWFRYQQQQDKINLHTAIDFIAVYMQIIYIYQGVKDSSLGLSTLQNYFNWVHDAFTIYEWAQDHKYGN